MFWKGTSREREPHSVVSGYCWSFSCWWRSAWPGGWAQPQWCFTPTAAATIFAGCYFARLGVAALVPIAILGISDLALESHDSIGVMLATYAVMTVPVLFGRWLRTSEGRANTLVRLAVCGLVPAILFWLVSNFAVWAFQSDYEKSWAGLMHCYLRPCRSSAGCSPATCSTWRCCSVARRWRDCR